MSPKVKTIEGEGIGVRSLARSISGVERHAGALLGRVTSLIIHANLHKPNNKLVNA
jgi:hypothetical protein